MRKRSARRVRARRGLMLYYALVFLIVALIAGALGVSGVAAVATNIAYVLFVIAIVLFLVHLLSGRRTLAPRGDTLGRVWCPPLFSLGVPLPATTPRDFNDLRRSDSLSLTDESWSPAAGRSG